MLVENTNGTAEDRLRADQLAELPNLLIGASVSEQGVFEALASCILQQADELTSAGATLLGRTFSEDGRGPQFDNRSELMRLVRVVRAKSETARKRPRRVLEECG